MKNSRLDSLARGLIAGLVATCVLSLLIVLKQALGLMPNLNLVVVLAHALGHRSAVAGWIAHYIVGVLLWGPLFALLDRKSSFPHWFNGLMFASVIWGGVMLIIMPAAGAGLFGLRFGTAAPSVTLLLHWAYGAVLGTVYGSQDSGLLTRAFSGGHWHWPSHRPHHA